MNSSTDKLISLNNGAQHPFSKRLVCRDHNHQVVFSAAKQRSIFLLVNEPQNYVATLLVDDYISYGYESFDDFVIVYRR